MAIGYVSSNAVQTNTGTTTLPGTAPGSLTTGQFMLATVSQSCAGSSVDSPIVTPAAGWTEINPGGVVDLGTPSARINQYYRFVQPGDSGATWNWIATTAQSAGAGATVIIDVYSGVDTGTPIVSGEQAFAAQSASSTTRTTASITTAGARWIHSTFSDKSGSGWTVGDTQRSFSRVSGGDCSTVTQDTNGNASAGSISKTVTASFSSSVGVSSILALNPAAGGVNFAGVFTMQASGFAPPPGTISMPDSSGDHTEAGGTTGTITLAKPSSMSDGDVILVHAMARNGSPLTLTGGVGAWTAIYTSTITAFGAEIVFAKYIPSASAEAAASAWVLTPPSSGNRTTAQVRRLVGATSDVTQLVEQASGEVSAGTGASMTLPTVTTAAPRDLLVAFCHSGESTSSTIPTITFSGAGWTQLASSGASTATQGALALGMAQQPTPNVNTYPGPGVTTSQASTNTAGFTGFILVLRSGIAQVNMVASFDMALAPSVQAGNSAHFTSAFSMVARATAPPHLLRTMVAISDPDRIILTVRAANVNTGVRVKLATNAGMTTGVQFSASVLPDFYGYVTNVTFPGLTGNTPYWYQVELDGVLFGSPIATKTRVAASGAFSFSLAFGSCIEGRGGNNPNGVDVSTFSAIRQRTSLSGGTGPEAFYHLGDMHYAYKSGSPAGTIAPPDTLDAIGNYEINLSQAQLSQLMGSIPSTHTWSDNDWCGSNSDGTYAAGPNVSEAWHRMMAYQPLPATDGKGIWHSEKYGRVLVIVTDGRQYMSLKGDADSPAKTKLGAEQKAWLKTQLARTDCSLIVWMHEDYWHQQQTATGSGSTLDDWAVYPSERAEIAAFIKTSSGAPVLYCCGDVHMLFADNGTHNAIGGFPTLAGAPFFQDTQVYPFGDSPSAGSYPPSNMTGQRFYGWLDFNDNGTDLSVTYHGYDAGANTGNPSDDVSRISYAYTVKAGTLVAFGLVGTMAAAAVATGNPTAYFASASDMGLGTVSGEPSFAATRPTAEVTLNRVWLLDPADPVNPIIAGSGGDNTGGGQRSDDDSIDGDFRYYAGGRARLVVRTATPRTETFALIAIDEAQAKQIESWKGRLLLFRDSYGHRIWGAYLTTSRYDFPLSGGLVGIQIEFTAITHSDAV